MIKQNFYLKSDKINTFGECPIFLKLSYKGNSTTLSTGKWITKERWKSTNKKVLSSNPSLPTKV